MPTLDELLQQSQGTQTPVSPPAPTSVQTAPVAPPAPAPLDALLQQSVAVDPSLNTSKDIDSTRGMRTLLAIGMNNVGVMQNQGPFDLYDVFTGAEGVFSSVVKAPGNAAEAVQNVLGIKNSWMSPASGIIALRDATQWFDDNIIPRKKDDVTAPWYEDIDSAVGSAAAFMAGGGVGEALQMPAWMTTAMLGGAVGASDQYDEAMFMGADPEQAALAYVGGGAFGLSEALSGTYFLQKINKFTGGKLYDTLKNFNQTKESTLVREALKGFLTEATQEGFQTVGENWVAKDLAGYDPTRTLDENFWSSFLTGGVVGSVLGGGIHSIRKAERNQVITALDQERRVRLETDDPINALSGTFTPLEDLLALRAIKADLDTEIQERGARVILDQGAPSLTEGPSDLIEKESQRPEVIGTNYDRVKKDFDEHIGSIRIDPAVEKSLPKNADGSPLTVMQAFKHTPVVAALSDPYSFEDASPYAQLLKTADTHIEILEEGIKANSNAPGIEVQKKKLEVLKKRRTEIATKQKIGRQILEQTKEYVAAFREAINPEMRMIVTDNLAFTAPKKSGYGSFMLIDNVEMEDKSRIPVGIVYINMDEVVTEAYNNKGQITTSGRMRLFETLSHELGHSIAVKSFADLVKKIRDPKTPPEEAEKSYKIFAFLVEEYDNWLKDAASSSQDYWMKTQAAPARGVNMQRMFNPAKSNMEPFMTEKPTKDYLFSFDEFFAEMTARIAARGDLADPVMTKFFSPVLKTYESVFQAMPHFAQDMYAKNWKTFLNSLTAEFKVEELKQMLAAGGGKNLIHALRARIPGFDPKNFAGLQQHLDKWSWGMNYGLNLIQMAKENPHIPHWQNYLNAVELWQNYQRNFAANATGVLTSWKELGKETASGLTDILFSEATDKKLMTEKQIVDKVGLTGLAVYKQIRAELNRVLDEMQKASVTDAQRTFGDRLTALEEELKLINDEFTKLKNGAYFPFMRYGKYTITARAKEPLVYNGESYKTGQLITFPVFENQRQRDEEIAVLRKQFGSKAAVASSVMSETEQTIQGMPRSLLRSLKNKLESAGPLSKEQQNAFDKALEDTAPFRNFRKHFVRKRFVGGYSEDGLRSFANYMGSAAGHISRVKFADQMREPVLGMQEDVEVIKEVGGRADERQEMKHWLDEHFKYIMNPENELAALRSVGFVAYLGFNVKSALVNMSQPFMITLPYLSARYGDAAAIEAMGRATWALKDWVSKKKQYLDAMPDEKGVIKKSNDKLRRQGEMIGQGIHEGWIDQSLATELAIARSENNLDRGLYLQKGRRFWHEASRYSALPFHLVEKMNRYITAFAAYDLEYQESGDHTKAVLAAKQANWSTNYENARWNRPKFMRGKKSVAFLFMNYVQNTVYFATHDKGATRYYLMMLMMAGFLGLPGAEDMEDLVDFSVTGLNKLLGVPNAKFALRQELREALEHLGANPDIILHGLSQSSFGLGHVGELTGLPIPRFDLSGSLGMGDIVPGTEIPKMAQAGRAPAEIAMEAASSLGGATGNLVETFYRGLTSTDPDQVKAMEKLMPMMSIRNVMKAKRLYERGGEFTKAGDPVATFDKMDLRDNMEILGQGFGFTPTKLSQGWERQIAVMDAVQYYKARQSALLSQHNWALWNEDREAQKDALDAISEYNQEVPFPEMGITGKSLKQSAKAYLQSHLEAEEGFGVDKKYLRLKDKVEENYPDPAGREFNSIPSNSSSP